MKEYQVVINREYTTYITLRFPDDGRDHKEIINEKIKEGDEEELVEGFDLEEI